MGCWAGEERRTREEKKPETNTNDSKIKIYSNLYTLGFYVYG